MCTIKYVRVEICVSETTRILTCPEAIVYICVDSRRSETTTHASFEIRTTPNSCTNLGESRIMVLAGARIRYDYCGTFLLRKNTTSQ